MKYILYHFCFFLFIISTNYAQSGSPSDKEILNGLNDVYNLKFNDAEFKFKQIQKLNPDDLKGYFYESLLYFYKALPSRDEKIFEKYLEYSDKVIERAEKILDKNENDYDALYYKGLSHSYRSLLMLTLNKSLLQAASDGNSGFRILSSLIEKRPDYYDAYMGLGLYKIAIGFVPEKFRWLLSLIGFEGNINEGISLLNTSMEKGRFTKVDSKVFLSFFSLREREDDDESSLNFSNELVKGFPDSPVFKVLHSGLLLQFGKTPEAISAAENALKLNTNSFQNEISKSANAILGSAYFRLNDFEKASPYLEEYMKHVNYEDRYNVYLFTLGVCYELSGDRQKALEKYEAVRNIFNNERDGELDKFFYRLSRNRIKMPLRDFDIMLIRAVNLRESGKFDESIKIYEDILSKKITERYNTDDDLIRFYYDYGLVNSYNKNPGKAAECFTRCIELNPTSETGLVPHSYFELGKIYNKRGDRQKSEEMFEKIFDYDDFDFKSFLEMRLANYRNK